MPTWDKVLDEVNEQLNALRILEKYVGQLHQLTGRSVVCYMSAFSIIKPPVPPPFHSIIDQDLQGFMTCAKDTDKNSLDLIIHTPGGDYEASKRIISYLHSTYRHIRVFVPHLAMSGGTLITCAADEIYMGPYSSLGPTDPQVLLGRNYIPVNAILNEFEQAFKDVISDPRKALLWNERLKLVPFGMLKAAETMRENSFLYLQELLKKRNCREKPDEEIKNAAEFINGRNMPVPHGQGISLERAQELGLNVKNLHSDKELEDRVLSVYHSAIILFQNTTAQKIILNHNRLKYINNYQSPEK
ncbi:MAG: hypothetical protein JXB23_10845 [Candidatus Aminicenantes bacterium]|nr:hypothetical protein [Candidatus Aminicenantes bacterium]